MGKPRDGRGCGLDGVSYMSPYHPCGLMYPCIVRKKTAVCNPSIILEALIIRESFSSWFPDDGFFCSLIKPRTALVFYCDPLMHCSGWLDPEGMYPLVNRYISCELTGIYPLGIQVYTFWVNGYAFCRSVGAHPLCWRVHTA